MINRIYDLTVFIRFFMSISIALTACSAVLAQTILVHPNNHNSAISPNKLRAIYSMKTRVWPDQTPISVFILNPHSKAHRNFCIKQLNIFPYQLQRVWDVMVYSGTGQAPIEVKSEDEMIKKIANTPGSIGYIVDPEVPDNVKIIQVQH